MTRASRSSSHDRSGEPPSVRSSDVPRSRGSRKAWIALAAAGALGAVYFASRTAPIAARASAAEERALGAKLASQGRFADAAAAYERSLAGSDDANVRKELALALESEGRFDLAAGELRHALALDPHDASGWYALGNLLRAQLKNFRGAMDAYRRAIDERPSMAEAHFALGAVLLDLGEPDDAAASIESSLSLAPPDVAWRPQAEEALLVARTRAAQRNVAKPKAETPSAK